MAVKEKQTELALKPLKGTLKTVPKETIKGFLDVIDYSIDEWQVSSIFQTIRKKEYYISGPRQFGKSQLSIACALILAFMGLKVLFLTHNVALSEDLMRRAVIYGRKLQEMGAVTQIYNNKNQKEIWFASGGCIKFGVRSPGVAVGTSWDAIFWDEAQKVSNEIVEEVLPILSQSKHRVQLHIGTPPTDQDLINYPDSPFIEARKRGGEAWKEFSAAPEYSPDIDISNLSLAKFSNPAWTRTPNFWDGLKKAQKTMSHEKYCRQYLGVWKADKKFNTHDPELTGKEVSAILTNRGSTARFFTCGVGINSASTKAYVSMNDGVVTEIAEVFDLDDGGFDSMVEWLVERARFVHSIRIPATVKGRALIETLKERRIGGKLKSTSMPEMDNFLSRFLKQTKANNLKVFRSSSVEMALGNFWLEYDSRSSTSVIKSGVPEDACLVLALVSSTVDENLTNRVSSAKAFWF